jgi:hypothetical protein
LVQSQERSGGIVVYTGMNNNGDSFIGNRKTSSATGEEITYDNPIPTVTGEDPSRLSVIFDEVTVKERLVVEGGNSGTVLSQFDGPVTFNKEIKVNANVNVKSQLKVSDATQSTTSTNGALVVSGGVGIVKNLNVGGSIFGNVIGNLTGNVTGSVTGNANSATKLATARNIAITGDLAWNVNFDGSANVTSVGTLANSGVTAATYGSATAVPQIAVDVKGRITSASNVTINIPVIGGSANQVIYRNNSNSITGSPNLTFNGTQLNSYRTRIGPFAGSTAATNAGNNVTGLEILNDGGTGENDVAAISFHCSGSYGMHMHLRADGYFGIGGWTAREWRWYVNMSNGDMSAAGDIIAFASDERLKENIQPLENALDKVLSLNGFTYNFNETGQSLGFNGSIRYVGVSAQEVQAVLPEAVKPAPVDSKYITVQYEKLVPLLIEAIKELKAEINELKGVK